MVEAAICLTRAEDAYAIIKVECGWLAKIVASKKRSHRHVEALHSPTTQSKWVQLIMACHGLHGNKTNTTTPALFSLVFG